MQTTVFSPQTRTSMRRKLYILLCVQVFIVLFWSVFSLHSSRRDFMAQTENVHRLTADSFSQKISARVTSMQNTSIFPMVSTRDHQFPEIYEYLTHPERAAQSIDTIYRNTSSRANELMSTQVGLSGMFVLDLSGSGIYTQKYAQYDTVSCPEVDAMLSAVRNARGGDVLFSGADLPLPFLSQNQLPLVLVRAITDRNTYLPIGYVGVCADTAALAEEFTQTRPYAGSELIILDGQNRSIWGQTGSVVPDPVLARCRATQKGSFYLDGWLYTFEPLPTSNLLCVLRSPLAQINTAFLSSRSGGLLFPFFVLLVSFLFMISLIRHVVQSITQMTHACEAVRSGDYTVCLPMPQEEDLRPMVDAFNQMAGRIDYLVNEVYAQTLTTQKLEIQMLREQINPHFLYNTLESLRMTAYSAAQYELSEMLALLGKLFRYSVDAMSAETTVARELQYIQDYLRLQQIRYADRFSLHLHCDPNLNTCTLPKMLLQPVVENVISHGFSDTSAHGRIDIMTYAEDTHLCISVSDNGCGMSAQTLEAVRCTLDSAEDLSVHIGLRNVHRRIQLTYGPPYGITVDAVEGRGTVVTLHIPLKKEVPHA